MQTYKVRCSVKAQTLYDGKLTDMTEGVRSINITKRMGEAAGTWRLEMLPTRDKDGVSWYHRFAPMDYVEIGFTRDSTLQKPPVVMRGFVDRVGMRVSVDGDGRPQRVYTVQGRDYGKLLEIAQIYYLIVVDSDLKLILLPSFEKLREKWGVRLGADPAGPAEIIGDLMNPAKGLLSQVKGTYRSAPDLAYLGSSNILGRVHGFDLSKEDGSCWEFMRHFSNSPWNELFLVDTTTGPTLIFRKTPWKKNGVLVQGDDSTYANYTTDPVVITPSDVISLDLTRSDAEVKNYLFTFPTQSLLGTDQSFKAMVLMGKQTVEQLKDNPFVDMTSKERGVNRFGFRRFENSTDYVAISANDSVGEARQLCETLNLNLANAYEQNADFESGTFTLRGNENIKIGRYLVQKAPSLVVKPEYYVQGVSHSLNLVAGSESFLTTVEVARGTGYIEIGQKLAGAKDLNAKRGISGGY